VRQTLARPRTSQPLWQPIVTLASQRYTNRCTRANRRGDATTRADRARATAPRADRRRVAFEASSRRPRGDARTQASA